MSDKAFSRGFTLLEFMIAILLFFFIFSGAVLLLEQSARSFRVNDLRAEVTDNMRISLDRMTRELLTSSYLVNADNQSLIFITTDNEGKDIEVSYYLGSFYNTLTREDTWGLYRKAGSNSANPVSLFIKEMWLETVRDSLSYPGAPGGVWDAVRVRITLIGGSRLLKEDIVMFSEVSLPAHRDVRY